MKISQIRRDKVYLKFFKLGTLTVTNNKLRN